MDGESGWSRKNLSRRLEIWILIAAWQRKVLGVTALLAFWLIVYHADRGPDWPQPLYVHPGGDKLGHVMVAALLNLAFSLSSARRTALARGSVLTVLLMTAEEFSQVLLPTRTFSWVDLGCDYLGVLLISMLIKKNFTACGEQQIWQRPESMGYNCSKALSAGS